MKYSFGLYKCIFTDYDKKQLFKALNFYNIALVGLGVNMFFIIDKYNENIYAVFITLVRTIQ